MANTTNYNWETPDDTDLVKDGALAIRTFGSSVDTTTKALNPSTTLGDIEYRSATANTNTRLGIGSTGNVLTVAGGVPTWAAPAPAASGFNFISRTSFSNVSSQAFDNVFTSTYKRYVIVIENIFAATYTDDLQIQFRYAGPTTQTAQYYSYSKGYSGNGTNQDVGALNAAQMIIANGTGFDASLAGSGQFFVAGVGNTSETVRITGSFVEPTEALGYTFYGAGQTARTYTGFLLKSSSSNITGTVAVYGLATS